MESETFGLTLRGLIFEAVRNPRDRQNLLLHLYNGNEFKTVEKFKNVGTTYLPRALSGALADAVRIAPPSLPFKSPVALMSSVQNFISAYLCLSPDTMAQLLAFVLATWFCDALPVAPVLYLLGPEPEVSTAMRLLSCVCRRALLLGDVNLDALSTLPAGLCPTLLFNQSYYDDRFMRPLLASNRRQFCVARARGRMDLYGAKAFACDESPTDQLGLTVSLPLPRVPLPLLSDTEEEQKSRNFQAKFLRYRLSNYDAVRNCLPDYRCVGSGLREQMQTWLAPITGFSELQQRVSAELMRQARGLAAARFTDAKCVVAEAALHFCHKQEADHFFIGQLTDTANALLKARHEESEISAKRVGAILRALGVPSQRVAKGFRIELDHAVRQRIHRVASDNGVLSVDGVKRCDHCAEIANTKQV